MRLPHLVLGACFALAAALPMARALPAAEQIAAAFREMDSTANNAISPAEWQRASFALFRAADKNNNDFIEAEEVKGSAVAQDTFLRLDTDGDGRLSVNEFMKLRRDLFAVADINHDDYLVFVEYELFIVFEAVGWQDRNRSGRMEVTEMRAVLANLFTTLDANHDAALDKTEAAYMPATRFDSFDQNKDGKLSVDELIAGYRHEFEG